MRITNKNLRKLTSAVEFGPSKLQNRIAYAKLALHVGLEVTRRDGLSSWIVILFMAAGMLIGNSGGNYVYENFENMIFRPIAPI